jgi:hypothetical protein
MLYDLSVRLPRNASAYFDPQAGRLRPEVLGRFGDGCISPIQRPYTAETADENVC